jgi:hypothetical protein
MVETQSNIGYPIKDISRVCVIGNGTIYIRIPRRLVDLGQVSLPNRQPLLITIENENRIVITPYK